MTHPVLIPLLRQTLDCGFVSHQTGKKKKRKEKTVVAMATDAWGEEEIKTASGSENERVTQQISGRWS